MKIAYIAAGAAGMYCGSCLHDNRLARVLLELGEDVILVPTYTPIRTDEVDVSHGRVFFGGINAYLQQHVPLFRKTPRWVDRLFNSRWLLNLATSGAGSVDPAKLGGMTVSMLRGEEGHQAKEVDKLVDWLVDEVQPDVVHLSNSMLLGMARRINQRCGPPVVCALSGEDIFLEQLAEPHYSQARALLRERAAEVAAFTTLNRYYADFMADYLAVDRAKVHVVPHGLDLTEYSEEAADHRLRLEIGEERWQTLNSPDVVHEHLPGVPVIGYLARICHDKGLHVLVEACELLNKMPGFEYGFELKVAGYLGEGDKPYFAEILKRIERADMTGIFYHNGELSLGEKIDFLRGLNVFCTPTVYRESKGLPAIEALAAGTPVLLPDHGSFPELVAESGGGLLHRPEDPAHLAERLAELLADLDRARKLGETGREHVHTHRHARRMAENTLGLYGTIVSQAV
ncbi:MAG: glycosyltransferase family 4 protein [Planctomycetota bacterium]